MGHFGLDWPVDLKWPCEGIPNTGWDCNANLGGPTKRSNQEGQYLLDRPTFLFYCYTLSPSQLPINQDAKSVFAKVRPFWNLAVLPQNIIYYSSVMKRMSQMRYDLDTDCELKLCL